MNVEIKEVAEVVGNLITILDGEWFPKIEIGNGHLDRIHSMSICKFWPLVDIDQLERSLERPNKAAVVKDYLLSKYGDSDER